MLDEFPTPTDLKGALAGTLLYLSLYTVFQCFQSYNTFKLLAQKKREAKDKQAKDGSTTTRVSYRSVKYYNSRDFLALWGDRTTGNFREWALVFLPLLWMHALFINPQVSFQQSLWYIFFRSLYPFLFRKGGLWVLASTLPSYVVLMVIGYPLFVQAFFGMI